MNKQNYLYFTIEDKNEDLPSLKITKINSNYSAISYISDIIPEDKDNPVKQTTCRCEKTQDLSLLANYIETCFTDKANIIIRSNMFNIKVPYSFETLSKCMELLYQ